MIDVVARTVGPLAGVEVIASVAAREVHPGLWPCAQLSASTGAADLPPATSDVSLKRKQVAVRVRRSKPRRPVPRGDRRDGLADDAERVVGELGTFAHLSLIDLETRVMITVV